MGGIICIGGLVMHENAFTIVIGAIGGFLSYCFDISPFFHVLLWAITLDLTVGVIASFINENLKFNSKNLSKGICKKVSYINVGRVFTPIRRYATYGYYL